MAKDQSLAIQASCPIKKQQEAINPWLKLALGIALVLLFMFGAGRLSTYIPGAQRMAQVIDDHELRATAIFYTDFETSAASAEYIRHSLAYPPRHQ
jgi:hypothetical protein